MAVEANEHDLCSSVSQSIYGPPVLLTSPFEVVIQGGHQSPLFVSSIQRIIAEQIRFIIQYSRSRDEASMVRRPYIYI